MRARRWLLPTIVLILFSADVPRLSSQRRTSPKPAQAASAQAQAQEGIAALQKNEIMAIMGLNVDRLLDLWTADAVLLPPRHEPVVGKAALRRFFEEKKDRFGNYDMLAYDENWDEVMVVGDYAWQWGSVSYRMKPPTGSEFGATVHALRILKHEEDGGWRVARAMWNEAPATQ
jgi:ketosteroid isomerase-like protein